MFEGIIRFLVARGKREFGVGARILATVLGAATFVVLFPALAGWFGTFGVLRSPLLPESPARVLAFLFFICGTPWMVWSVYWQLAKSGGTPVPALPPRQFLATGPYRYTRNPMMFGFWGYLLGWVFFFNSAGAFLTAFLVIAFFGAELKWVEEKELEIRFGDVYREYKAKTPFLIPRLKSIRRNLFQ